MSKEAEHHIDACNGEIRIQACRYGSGWMCVLLLEEICLDSEEKRFNDMFCDMVGGDNDYFVARSYFERKDNIILEYGETPAQALNSAMNKYMEASK